MELFLFVFLHHVPWADKQSRMGNSGVETTISVFPLLYSWSHLWRGTLTGMEVADRKSVMRFLLTISVSALPGSRRDVEWNSALLYNSLAPRCCGTFFHQAPTTNTTKPIPFLMVSESCNMYWTIYIT